MTMTASLTLKHNLSKRHFKSALFFSNSAKEIELSHKIPIDEGTRTQYNAFVSGSIILSVATIESSINEFYCEAVDRSKEKLKGLDLETISILGEFWLEIERLPILQKYQKALFFIGIKKFDEGSKVFQDANYLIKLRDLLVHYKPEWDNKLKEHAKVEKNLRGKFVLSPFSSKNSLWFPHQCLGYGCCCWANETVINFIKAFCKKAKIPDRL